MRPLAVTLGDPAGIGPEIAYRAWERLRDDGPAFFAIGDPAAIEAALASQGGPPALAPIDSPKACATHFTNALPVLSRPLASPAVPGTPDAQNGQAVIDWIAEAVRFVGDGSASGVVTCPIAKSVLYDAGFTFPGHTEYLANLSADWPQEEPRGPVMMLVGGGLRVALATIHTPLKDVPVSLTIDGVMRVVQVTARALSRDFGLAEPRIALCGLNPHAGEAGALGTEERDIINPAAERLRVDGLNITDALPADGLFNTDARSGYDAIIAMYHDQGLIPVKALDFHGGVNVTLGLPLVRTSPDHGTAFGIAGTGQARADSLVAAIKLAAEMAARRADASS